MLRLSLGVVVASVLLALVFWLWRSYFPQQKLPIAIASSTDAPNTLGPSLSPTLPDSLTSLSITEKNPLLEMFSKKRVIVGLVSFLALLVVSISLVGLLYFLDVFTPDAPIVALASLEKQLAMVQPHLELDSYTCEESNQVSTFELEDFVETSHVPIVVLLVMGVILISIALFGGSFYGFFKETWTENKGQSSGGGVSTTRQEKKFSFLENAEFKKYDHSTNENKRPIDTADEKHRFQDPSFNDQVHTESDYSTYNRRDGNEEEHNVNGDYSSVWLSSHDTQIEKESRFRHVD